VGGLLDGSVQSGMIVDPVTLRVSNSLADAWRIMEQYHISGVPIVDEEMRLMGILTNRDIRFETGGEKAVQELMTSRDLVTATVGTSSRSLLVDVSSALVIDSAYATSRVPVGAFINGSVSTNVDVISDTTISITSSNPAAVSTPASVVIPTGSSSATVPMNALALGRSLVTFTLDGSSRSILITVTGGPSISYISVPSRLLLGTPANLTVSLDMTPVTETTLLLSSSNPAARSQSSAARAWRMASGGNPFCSNHALARLCRLDTCSGCASIRRVFSTSAKRW
jgi:hypothetical protein